MPDIVLSPQSFEDLIRQVEDVRRIASLRKVSGWPLFMDDETWQYETTGNNTCDVCYDLEDVFNSPDTNGPLITTMFPQWVRSGTFQIRPQVHENPDYPQLSGPCNCTIILMHPMDTLKERLRLEIEEMAK